MISGGGQRSQAEGSGLRWRGAISGGGERTQVQESGLRRRGAVSGGGERSEVKGSGLRWREAVVHNRTVQVFANQPFKTFLFNLFK